MKRRTMLGTALFFAILLVIGVYVFNYLNVGRPLKNESDAAPPTQSLSVSTSITDDDNEWSVLESKNEMDNTPEVFLSKSGSDEARLYIRCVGHKTEALVSTDTVIDNGSVRVRFGDSAPSEQYWIESANHQALFAPDAITFARKLAKARTFLFEFRPFQKMARTVSFDVSGLDVKLNKISEICDWDAVDKGRAKVSQYVKRCDPSGAFAGQWCWSDPDDPVLRDLEYPSDTREEALKEAIKYAESGLAFKKK